MENGSASMVEQAGVEPASAALFNNTCNTAIF